jgi:hypothetical protein
MNLARYSFNSCQSRCRKFMSQTFATTAEWHNVDAAVFRREILPRSRPAILRGVVRDWPAVQAGLKSPQTAADVLKACDIGRTVETYVADAAIGGRFFYRDDLRSFNFERRPERISTAIDRMLAHIGDPQPPAIYVQSTPLSEYMPEFRRTHVLALMGESVAPRIWIGNAVTVTTHYDLSDNIACVVAGRRRFTFFPPEQLPNMYMGPLEFTPGGAPVSLVDPENPDLERYPLFERALAVAETAELGPGDAVFIPYSWWHHVRSLAPFNVLVNYWWNDARVPLASPYDCLLHAILALREMPENQRATWRTIFDYHVFKSHGEPLAHLPPENRGGLGPMTPERAQHLKATLLRALTRTIGGR